jgi:hypothetical protein
MGLKCGRLAQLGERRVRNAEARSSILLPSTNFMYIGQSALIFNTARV